MEEESTSPTSQEEDGDSAGQGPRRPKVAFSYAWTSERHKEWVLALATRLQTNGVEVVIDAWNLAPGDDMYVFMEGLVTDETVTNVLLICDEEYAKKANERGRTPSGVGTEASIISPDLYPKAKQSKFIPVIAQNDEAGEPFVPAFLKGRIHIDLSSDQVYEGEYEKLLRLLFGKPALSPPPLGTPPRYIAEDAETGSSTRHLYARARRLIVSGDRQTRGAIEDYLDGLVEALGGMRTKNPQTGSFDEVLVERIGESKVYRDEFVEVVSLITRHWNASEAWPITGAFFEDLLAKCAPAAPEGHQPAEFEPVQFAVYELFLSYVALLSNANKTDPLEDILTEQFIGDEDYGPERARGFETMHFRFEQIEDARGRRSKRTSPVADLIKQRCDDGHVPFAALSQTDFLLFLKANARNAHWSPRTLVYASHPFPRPFPVFVGMGSPRRKELLKVFLGVEDAEGLLKFFEESSPQPQSWTMRFSDHHLGVSIPRLMNLHNLDPSKYGTDRG